MLHYLQNLLQALDLGSLTDAFLRVAAIFICLSVHETCHGLAAYALGDPTAKAMNRLSLNPLRHIDWFGLAMMFVAGFGWAKPVPVQSRYFANQRTGMMLVAVAGPLTNFVLALLSAFALRMVMGTFSYGGELSFVQYALFNMLYFGVWINCVLAIFNLLPIPPLDGSHILTGFLPDSLARAYWGLGRYSMVLVILLVASGALGSVLIPLVLGCARFICLLAGVNPDLIGFV